MNERIANTVIDSTSEASYTVARAMQVPDGWDTLILPLNALDPICQIQEETFYQFVLDSMRGHGLFHPLVIHPLTVDDWKKELEYDKFQTPPPMDEDPMRLRIQTGCNRYFALLELGFTAVECIVVEDLKEAQDLGFVMSRDKKWQRGSNLDLLKEKRSGV